jgi:hypothetical protein
MQQQLNAARAELHHTQTLLQQLMQESAAAVKAACDQRCGALRLLLAEKLQELQDCEQQRAAAQQLAEAKASPSRHSSSCCMQLAAAACSSCPVVSHCADSASHTLLQAEDYEAMRAALAAANAHIALTAAQAVEQQAAQQPSTLPAAPHDDASAVVQELQGQLQVQRRQLEAADEQVKELVQHLALRLDAAEFAERRSALLEKQVDAVYMRTA